MKRKAPDRIERLEALLEWFCDYINDVCPSKDDPVWEKCQEARDLMKNPHPGLLEASEGIGDLKPLTPPPANFHQ